MEEILGRYEQLREMLRVKVSRREDKCRDALEEMLVKSGWMVDRLGDLPDMALHKERYT